MSPIDAPKKELPAIFAAHGLRCTRQRVAVYQALVTSGEHPTADQIYQALQTRDAAISLATVYNTLEALCSAGLAQKLPGTGGKGPCRFDIARGNHLHLRDAQTGDIADVPDDLGEQILAAIPRHLLSELEAKLNFRVDRLEIQLIGEKQG
jgi:Fe2+ or Zn2+ uptake regulation protein